MIGAVRMKARDLGSATPIDTHLADAVADRVAAHMARSPASPWMTTTEAAEYLRCGTDRLKRLASERRIPVHKEGNRNLYRREELDEWIRSGAAAEVVGTCC